MANIVPDPTRIHHRKAQRVEGEILWYLVFYNTISGLLFILITTSMGIYELKEDTISIILTSDFLFLIFAIFVVSLITSIIGRIVAFFTLKFIFTQYGKNMKRFGEINTGMNKIGMVYIISTLITTILFAFGAVAILENVIYDKTTVLTLFATYLILKITVYILVKLFFNFKL